VGQKHEIRRHLNLQLVELWKEHPDLRSQATSLFFKSDRGDGIQHIIPAPPHVSDAPNVKTWLQFIAEDHVRCSHHFVPLVSIAGGFTCSLDILFLRRDSPGSLVKSGGDIDNRIKTLLDALTIPNESQLAGIKFEPHEQPFYTLLEDDFYHRTVREDGSLVDSADLRRAH
jgi:hypothetical protein